MEVVLMSIEVNFQIWPPGKRHNQGTVNLIHTAATKRDSVSSTEYMLVSGHKGPPGHGPGVPPQGHTCLASTGSPHAFPSVAVAMENGQHCTI